MRRATGLSIVLLLLLIAAASAQPLPMPPVPGAAPPDPSWLGSIVAYVQHVQGDLYRALAKAVHAVKDEGSLSTASWLLALSFFYGVVHAAGPGHGKVVIATYLVANEQAVRRGVILSFLSAAAQGVTAVLVIAILRVLLGFLSSQISDATIFLEIASYAMIATIGGYLIFRTIRDIVQSLQPHVHAHAHAHSHDGHGHHDHHHAHLAPSDIRTWREGLSVVASVGIRPCGGAIIVLFFALTQGIFFLGVLATAAMSLGTAITVATLAIVASSARTVALKLAGTMDGWLLRAYWSLSLGGGLVLLIMGLALLTAPAVVPLPGAG